MTYLPENEELPVRIPDRVLFVIRESAAQFGLTPALIIKSAHRRNDQHQVAARRVAARKLSKMGLSLPLIGRYLGGLHHTTILNLLRRDGCMRVQERKPPPKLSTKPWEPDESGFWAI